jgi:hypothetical protein
MGAWISDLFNYNEDYRRSQAIAENFFETRKNLGRSTEAVFRRNPVFEIFAGKIELANR